MPRLPELNYIGDSLVIGTSRKEKERERPILPATKITAH